MLSDINKELAERVLSGFVAVDDCWVWAGPPANTGYGQLSFKYDGKTWGVRNTHRIMYELFIGEIPGGLDLDHLCRNRLCVNPDHLEPVTRKVNLLRGNTIPARNKAKTHCPSGHHYSQENTQLVKDGSRKCKTCCYARKVAWRKAKQLKGERYS